MELILTISSGLLVGCLVAISWFAGSDAPYVPTKIELLKKILNTAGVKKGKKFYELGSGDGRVVIEAAKLGAESIGIEQSILRIVYSKIVAKKLNLSNARFLHGNVFSKNYQDADIVYIYLLPKGVSRLEKQLRNQLPKRAIVITQTFHFTNWKPYKKLDLFNEFDLSKDIKGAGSFYFYQR
ncbi:methyltransferase domain-containing protein [Candidatus Daviesbacteria bacterium]|nr:methyltransferase domain-containing protein [Candidatus Daviesbacteria bacterium]